MTRTYADRTQQAAYDACIVAHADRESEFYFTDRDGSRQPLRLAGHRNAFWNGFEGLPNRTYSRNTTAYACYMAGRDCAKRAKARGE